MSEHIFGSEKLSLAIFAMIVIISWRVMILIRVLLCSVIYGILWWLWPWVSRLQTNWGKRFRLRFFYRTTLKHRWRSHSITIMIPICLFIRASRSTKSRIGFLMTGWWSRSWGVWLNRCAVLELLLSLIIWWNLLLPALAENSLILLKLLSKTKVRANYGALFAGKVKAFPVSHVMLTHQVGNHAAARSWYSCKAMHKYPSFWNSFLNEPIRSFI